MRVRGAHRAEPVPHLADVLAALPDTRFTVELKSGAAVRPVLACWPELDAWDRVCLAGLPRAWLRRRAPARSGRRAVVHVDGPPVGAGPAPAGLGALPGRLAHAVRRTVGPLAVRGDLAQLPHRFAGLTVVDADVLRVAHGSGREVHVWTVDDPAVMAGLLDAGADGIITDRPDLLRDVLHGRGRDRRAS